MNYKSKYLGLLFALIAPFMFGTLALGADSSEETASDNDIQINDQNENKIPGSDEIKRSDNNDDDELSDEDLRSNKSKKFKRKKTASEKKPKNKKGKRKRTKSEKKSKKKRKARENHKNKDEKDEHKSKRKKTSSVDGKSAKKSTDVKRANKRTSTNYKNTNDVEGIAVSSETANQKATKNDKNILSVSKIREKDPQKIYDFKWVENMFHKEENIFYNWAICYFILRIFDKTKYLPILVKSKDIEFKYMLEENRKYLNVHFINLFEVYRLLPTISYKSGVDFFSKYKDDFKKLKNPNTGPTAKIKKADNFYEWIAEEKGKKAKIIEHYHKEADSLCELCKLKEIANVLNDKDKLAAYVKKQIEENGISRDVVSLPLEKTKQEEKKPVQQKTSSDLLFSNSVPPTDSNNAGSESSKQPSNVSGEGKNLANTVSLVPQEFLTTLVTSFQAQMTACQNQMIIYQNQITNQNENIKNQIATQNEVIKKLGEKLEKGKLEKKKLEKENRKNLLYYTTHSSPSNDANSPAPTPNTPGTPSNPKTPKGQNPSNSLSTSKNQLPKSPHVYPSPEYTNIPKRNN